VKSRIILGVLAGIGIIALSVTPVQAGRGSGVPAPLNTFFECQVVDGTNVNRTVNTCDPGSDCTAPDPNNPESGGLRNSLNVGNGVLLCRQVDVKDSSGFLTPEFSFDFKCYSVNRPGTKTGTVNQQLIDVFIDETARVTQQPGYLCAPVDIN